MELKTFLFHRVHPQRDPMWDPIDPLHFDFIIKTLSEQFELVQFEKFMLGDHKQQTNKPLASVVFDDGYKDFIEYALPVLKKYNCPASMYIVTNCINNQLPPWTYILDEQLYHTQKLVLDFSSTMIAGLNKKFVFKNVEERMEFGRKLKIRLKQIPNNLRLHICKLVSEQFDDVIISDSLMMTWEELKQISEEGVEIGSHSKSHPLLAKIESEFDLKEELEDAYKEISLHLGKPPISISYPVGSYNQHVMEIASQVGYKLGLAVLQRSFRVSKVQMMGIPRIELYNESVFKTKLRMSGKLEQIKKLIGR